MSAINVGETIISKTEDFIIQYLARQKVKSDCGLIIIFYDMINIRAGCDRPAEPPAFVYFPMRRRISLNNINHAAPSA
ncbi:hypothetical protein AW736_15745 [Termitidicoccus mucosus]|uniref:Uncharacterized protein n=1 Tax=Termitidicoccus mucosus TaxID=1184151 RepID=A0A178IF92_9BACT|nr:hypothetical protein AW736_15745 [Opitutaceae bacterium TSB47]